MLRRSFRRPPDRGGPLQFPPPPSERSMPHTPESPWRLHLQGLHRFRGLRPDFPGSALPLPRPKAGPLTTRQAFAFMLRTAQLLPLKGLLTLGFDPTRFQIEPPVCYRASWQLPGPDSHRLATTSLSLSDQLNRITSNCLDARKVWAKRRPGSVVSADRTPLRLAHLEIEGWRAFPSAR